MILIIKDGICVERGPIEEREEGFYVVSKDLYYPYELECQLLSEEGVPEWVQPDAAIYKDGVWEHWVPEEQPQIEE